ncbi:MAG TPA: methylenetetrahydrofolate reductase [NAD(P)H] [Acidiphilium sp.]|nr:methylenetetrahydrofolate reductase [NAD(P)H] [Acidiphilium sp.]HQU25351.1 methylenetetrahydrofolate reductase [NAD(P)H] [Acidiphilium sp.]
MTPDLSLSFEFFPPRSEAARASLWSTLDALTPLAPRFVTITYGAGGTTREHTETTAAAIAAQTGIPAAAHLTCVDTDRATTLATARHFWQAGLRHIVALRGDPPRAGENFVPRQDGFANARELVAALKTVAPFEISVAAYPDGHPDSIGADADLDYLKAKIDAGADQILTNFFFDPEAFLRLRDRAAAAGIAAPVIPGIMPIVNVAQLRNFAQRCGLTIPPNFNQSLDGLDEQPDQRDAFAINFALNLCQSLRAEGVRHFHFYTLNRAKLPHAICAALGGASR